MATIQDIGKALGEAASSVGNYSAQSAIKANEISRQAQSAQGAFNQESANQANMINDQTMSNQYAYNAAMMTNANNLNQIMWNQAANWNEEMWERQAKYNAEQAEIQRNWQEKMANTQYQRAVADMSKAGLNPILAVNGNGINGSIPGGATASVGGAQMSSASAAMASGGLLGANTASESNYMGQMENMSSWLALIGAAFNGISSAQSAIGQLGDFGEGLAESVEDFFMPEGTARRTLYDKATEVGKDLKEKVSNWWNGKGFKTNGDVKEAQSQFNAYKTNQRRDAYWKIQNRYNFNG